ncbi:PREDICTED: transcription factor bHLH68-like [Tarenaya hassleriana]|uniref:transcription factor bHLH68-like n=1 Tax=Tarenaya hassleriana TaxID=28532 RepID=UPI00053C52FC|nr:PREDICTED: transcription factor bHLH68-like [Tarenaya hassleriana]
MNRAGVIENSPVQQLAATGNPNWWSVSGGMRPPPPLMSHQPPQLSPYSFLRPPPTLPPSLPSLLPQFLPSPTSSSSSSSPSFPSHNPNVSSWPDYYDLPPESWSLSQLLLGGLMMGEEERMIMSQQGKKLENWEEQVLSHQAFMAADVKQENNSNNSSNGYVMSPNSSPPNNNNNDTNSKSCVTANTTTSLTSSGNNSMLDFSSNHHNGITKSDIGRHHLPPDRSSECHSSETGGSANKKPRFQASPPSTQSTLKVRKEKLGGRIAALHQLVSPFGKTDTASVLSESIGYIRFLQSQIEALSLPYFGTASGNMRHPQHVQGDRNCIFPEDPGQLVNEHCMKRRGASSSSSDDQNPNSNEEPKKDLRSRGLCLVPVSFTLQVGSDNGADYWAPALGAGFQ